MANRKKKKKRVHHIKPRHARHPRALRSPQGVDREPDLLGEVRRALASESALDLLMLVSTVLVALAPPAEIRAGDVGRVGGRCRHLRR